MDLIDDQPATGRKLRVLTINDTLVRDLAGGGFLTQQRNLVLIGGTGKTHLAVGIARACIRDDAIRNAVSVANQSIRNLEWFEVTEIRGHVASDGSVGHFQVGVKLGFRFERRPSS